MLDRLRPWEHQAVPLPRVVVFGDSLLGCQTVDVPGLVGTALQRAGRLVQIIRADAGGFRPLQFYYLLDDVIATRPSLAIVEVNLGSLGITGILRQIRYLPLSRTLSFAQAFRVRDALAVDDLTVLDPWLYRLEDRYGLLYVNDGIQTWARQQLDDAGGRVNKAFGLRVSKLDLRATRLMMPANMAVSTRRQFDVDQTRLPMTGALRQVYDTLRSAGVDVQLWVPPINIQRLAELGVGDELALTERIERLRVAIGATPEEWLDLHALYAKAVFVDWVGHAKPEGCQQTAARIVAALAARGLPRGAPTSSQAGNAQNWK